VSDSEFNPLTGDPDLLQRKARHYANIADAITRSVTTLKKINDLGEMKSKATTALQNKAEDVANDIEKARDRYAVTAKALLTYSTSLRSAQDAADAAITHIHQKQTESDNANRASRAAEHDTESAADADKSTAQTAANKAFDAATNASGGLKAAHDEWHAALAMKNDAAAIAVKAIVDVVDGKGNHGLEDSFWDDWGDVIKKICEIAGFLSIFLSWVPILGAILVGLAILGALITLVESIVAFANGGSFTDVLFAAVGLVLAAFGGKFIGYLAKLTKFSAASKVMTKGENFLNSKAFKKVFGESKAALKSGELKSLFHEGPGFKTMMKDIANPFDLKLGSSGNFAEKFAGGFKSEWSTFAKNPLGLSTVDMGSKVFTLAPTSGAKIAMVAADGRTVLGTAEELWNSPDDIFFGGGHHITISPDSLLQKGGNALESKVRG